MPTVSPKGRRSTRARKRRNSTPRRGTRRSKRLKQDGQPTTGSNNLTPVRSPAMLGQEKRDKLNPHSSQKKKQQASKTTAKLSGKEMMEKLDKDVPVYKRPGGEGYMVGNFDVHELEPSRENEVRFENNMRPDSPVYIRRTDGRIFIREEATKMMNADRGGVGESKDGVVEEFESPVDTNKKEEIGINPQWGRRLIWMWILPIRLIRI